MLFGLVFLLACAIAILCMMAVLELVYPPAGVKLSNCWWYAVVLQWKEGGAAVMVPSRYTILPHFLHTFDFETFTAFDPPAKVRRILPPWAFWGSIKTVKREDVMDGRI